MFKWTFIVAFCCWWLVGCYQPKGDTISLCSNIFYQAIDYGVKKGDINFSYMNGKVDSVNYYNYMLPRAGLLIESTSVDSQALLLKTLKLFFKDNSIDSVVNLTCPIVKGIQEIAGMKTSFIESDTITMRLSEFMKYKYINEDTYGIIQFVNPIEFKVLSEYYLAIGMYTKSDNFFNKNTRVFLFRRRDDVYLPVKILTPLRG